MEPLIGSQGNIVNPKRATDHLFHLEKGSIPPPSPEQCIIEKYLPVQYMFLPYLHQNSQYYGVKISHHLQLSIPLPVMKNVISLWWTILGIRISLHCKCSWFRMWKHFPLPQSTPLPITFPQFFVFLYRGCKNSWYEVLSYCFQLGSLV